MDAPPEKVWDLVSDVTRIGEFSPETFDGKWVDGATGPAVGAKFKGHVKRNGRGPTYWTECTVNACEPGRVFGFGVGVGKRVVNSWRYDLEPRDGGTDVTESFALTETPFTRIYWKLLGGLRGKTNERGMRTTLERMKAVVEK
jgi:uncharacterized protein YndB with AHSA1/START domain